MGWVFSLKGSHLNVSTTGWPSSLLPRQNGCNCYYKVKPTYSHLWFHPFILHKVLQIHLKTAAIVHTIFSLRRNFPKWRPSMFSVFVHFCILWNCYNCGGKSVLTPIYFLASWFFCCFLSLKGQECLIDNAQHETEVDIKAHVILCVEMQKADILWQSGMVHM